MLKAANRATEAHYQVSYLCARNLQKVSCAILQTIDNLWKEYSGGKFGFTSQAYIWEKTEHNFERFCDEVGWYSEDTPITTPQYSIEAPQGHLPSLECAVSTTYMKAVWQSGHITSGPVAFWLAKKEIISCIAEKLHACDEQIDNLSSDKGIDYSRLRDLLKAGKWKEADQETADRMCEAVGRQTEGWLRVADIKTFPCSDLCTIDQLWVKYSNGHFGFSVQKQIWQQCGKNWDRFCSSLGWRVKGTYKDYQYLKFDTHTSSKGELPASLPWDVELSASPISSNKVRLGWGPSFLVDSSGWVGEHVFSSLIQRLVACSMHQS